MKKINEYGTIINGFISEFGDIYNNGLSERGLILLDHEEGIVIRVFEMLYLTDKMTALSRLRLIVRKLNGMIKNDRSSTRVKITKYTAKVKLSEE